MRPIDFTESIRRTESAADPGNLERNGRLLHAALGLADESGEFCKALKKACFYGLPLDRDNVLEEVGDILWYLALALDELGFSFEQAMGANFLKLQKRYSSGFSAEECEDRNITAEMEAIASINDEDPWPDEPNRDPIQIKSGITASKKGSE